jgi:hypothetical protein
MAGILDCPGCAERREQIKERMKALTEWFKNPGGTPNPSLLTPPPAPQIHARPIKSKKDKSP